MLIKMVWYGIAELCEGAPVVIGGWVLTDRHDLCREQPSTSVGHFIKVAGNSNKNTLQVQCMRMAVHSHTTLDDCASLISLSLSFRSAV